jgi:aminopeptidase N
MPFAPLLSRSPVPDNWGYLPVIPDARRTPSGHPVTGSSTGHRAPAPGGQREIMPGPAGYDGGTCAVTFNLTRAEAAERARLLSVESYRVELDLTGGETTFRSVTTIAFRCARPGAATFADLTAPAVTEITLNGQPVSPAAYDGDRIALAGLAASNELRVVADCAYSRTGEGLHRFTDPADQAVYLYSDFETFDAHRVYACFDQPDLKAPFELTVTCPESWLAVSNMAPDSASESAGPGEPAGPGARSWHFPPSPPVPTYITALVAGPYHEVRDSHDGIPLGIYCRQSLAAYLDPDEIFEVTRQGFDYFHEAFGVRYPFGKYDQLFVPEYKSGAMENAGCVTFLESYLFRSRVTEAERERRAETILHEMAHMWFGDLVTMRWWDDLWLNESFASWASIVAQAAVTRWPHAWTTFAHAWKTWAYRQDQLPSTHPIAADIDDIAAVEVNFDGITYAKGAAVLKQLVAYVGQGNFLAAVRGYFARHAWGNATLADLLSALEQASGRDLSSWSKAWLETAGVSTLRPLYQTDAQGRLGSFAVRQEVADARDLPPTLRPHRIAIGLYDRTAAGLTRRLRVETDVTGDLTEVPELNGQARPDLVLVNDDDLTYAKIRLDDHSMATLIGGIGDFTDSLPAALCWSAAWDMCRDAELPARDYLRLVLSGADSVTDTVLLESVLGQAASAARRFADPAWRDSGLGQLAAALRGLLLSAQAGSDRQLACARALARVASGPADLELLSGLLDSSVRLDGLAVDTELRWLLLRRLVSRGAASPARIDAELERDQTDAGERHAARCRAALPDPAAKAAAWAAITSGTLPNAVFRATLGGFADLDQPDLLEPYTQRFFDEVAGLWDSWGLDMARFFAAAGYPAWAVTPAALATADDYLARDLPPALRRLLSEGRDGVARALRCRERDARAG